MFKYLILATSLAYSLTGTQEQGPRTGGYCAQSKQLKGARLTPETLDQVPRALDLGGLLHQARLAGSLLRV